MRPSRRLLGLAIGMLALSVLLLVLPGAPREMSLLLWAGLLGLVLTDLALTPGIRGMVLAVDGPSEVYAGEIAPMQARLEASQNLPDGPIEARLDLPDGLRLDAPFSLNRDRKTGDLAGTMQIRATRRGEFDLNQVWLNWPSRLGLMDITPKITLDDSLRVVPNIRPISSGQIDVTVRSELFGVKDNRIRGEGAEFHQLRDFTTGMDTRSIDWKRSARRRDLVAKEMRAERNHQIMLCLDNGYLMREEIAGLPKIDHAVNAALACAWAAGLGGDLVGLYSYDARPNLYAPPQPARMGFARIRSQLASLSYSEVESNPTLALAHLNGQLKRRSLIIIFSDFVDSTSAELLLENMAVLGRHHVMIFVTLRAPEPEAKATNEMDFSDIAEAVASGQIARERRMVLDKLRRMGVVCLDVEPGDLTPRLVSAYLSVKARGMI